MTHWQRPAGPSNVWKVIDGYEKLENGTKRAVKFSIQEVSYDGERRKEVLDLMYTYYLAEEPLSKAIKIKEDPEAVKDFQTICEYTLDQGIVTVCYQLDSDGKIEKLVGANMLYVATDETLKDLEERFKSEKFIKIWTLFKKLAHNADVCAIYKVDKYIASISLSVLPAYRGQKLGYHMLNARSEVAKKYGLPATSTLFSAAASQLQAKRAGFEERCSMDYVDLVDDEGNLLFPDIDQKCAKIMMKRFL